MRLGLISRKGIGLDGAGGETAMQVNSLKEAMGLCTEKIPVLGNKRPASNPMYARERLCSESLHLSGP